MNEGIGIKTFVAFSVKNIETRAAKLRTSDQMCVHSRKIIAGFELKIFRFASERPTSRPPARDIEMTHILNSGRVKIILLII